MPRTTNIDQISGAVLVTDAETRATVAACRGLHAAGATVDAVAGDTPAPAHWSSACRRRLRLPHPRAAPEAFVDGLAQLVRDGDYAALLPGSDSALLAISRHRDRLEPHVPLALPAHECVRQSLDKLYLAAVASQAGLGQPETRVGVGEAGALAVAHEIGFPVMVKPLAAAVEGVAAAAGSCRAEDARELARLAPTYGDSCLIQEVLPDATVLSYAGVFGGGEMRAYALSRYVRTWYPRAGSACFSETLRPDPELTQCVERLLSFIGWEGIFELELLVPPGGGCAAVDLNPRIYGSMALALASGVNLPGAWLDWALGREVAVGVHSRAGVRYRWTDADARNLLSRLRARDLRGTARGLRPRRGVAHPYFHRSDPGPAVGRALELTSRHLGGGEADSGARIDYSDRRTAMIAP